MSKENWWTAGRADRITKKRDREFELAQLEIISDAIDEIMADTNFPAHQKLINLHREWKSYTWKRRHLKGTVGCARRNKLHAAINREIAFAWESRDRFFSMLNLSVGDSLKSTTMHGTTYLQIERMANNMWAIGIHSSKHHVIHATFVKLASGSISQQHEAIKKLLLFSKLLATHGGLMLESVKEKNPVNYVGYA